MAGRNGKRMRATFRERPASSSPRSDPEEEYRWKDSVTTGAEMQAWIDDGTAQGLLPWFTKFNGVIPDKRWIAPVAESFALHAHLEPVLPTMTPTAEIAILDPSTTLRHHDHESREGGRGARPGLLPGAGRGEAAVRDALGPGDDAGEPRPVQGRDPRQLDLPLGRAGQDAARLRRARRQRRRRVRDRHPRPRTTSRATAWPSASCSASRRQAPPAVSSRTPMSRSTASIRSTPASMAPRGSSAARTLIAVEAAKGTEQPFLYVPDFPDLPMEEVYPREAPRGAAVVTREHKSGGRTVYIPWNIGAIFWEVLAADHQRSSPTPCAGRSASVRPVEVTGSGSSISRCASNDDGVAVVLNNLTNPMAMKGPIREIFPVRQAHRLGCDAREASASTKPGCSLPAARQGERGKRTRRGRGAGHRHARGRAPHLGVGGDAGAAMLRYVIKRLIYMIPTLFGMSIIAFLIIQLPPGDYLNSMLASMADAAQTSTRSRSRAIARSTASMTRSGCSTGNGSAASSSAGISATRSSGSGRSGT